MIDVIVVEEGDRRMLVSTDVWFGDETVQLPPKIYEAYVEASRRLHDVEKVIRNFTREQERQRGYAID